MRYVIIFIICLAFLYAFWYKDEILFANIPDAGKSFGYPFVVRDVAGWPSGKVTYYSENIIKNIFFDVAVAGTITFVYFILSKILKKN